MSYTIEEVNAYTKKILFHFDGLDLTEEVQKGLKAKQKAVNLKGFRKGKAPLNMLEKIYGNEAHADAINKFIQLQVTGTIDKEKLRSVSTPEVKALKYVPKESTSFEVVVEILPEVTVGDLSQYRFTKEKIEISEQEIEAWKKHYLENHAQMVPSKDGIVKKGHFAVINFKGEMPDGTFPKNMQNEEHIVEIGSKGLIPGFEDGLIGMRPEDKKTLDLTFPADYRDEKLRSAKVKFHVELLEIKEKQYPELTQEKIKELDFESLEDFNQKACDYVKREKENIAQKKLKESIIQKLIEDNDLAIPPALIAEQEKHMQDDFKKSLLAKGYEEKDVDEHLVKMASDFTNRAIAQIKSTLIFEVLSERFAIKVSGSEIDARIESSARAVGLDIKSMMKFYRSDEKAKHELVYSIREEKIFDKIFQQIQITEV